MRRRLFAIASAVSLLLCAATFALLCRSLGTEFTRGFVRRGVRWEFACRAGKIGIDNDPEIWEATRPEREEAEIRQQLKNEPWGTTAYYKTLEQVKALNNARLGKPALAPVVVARVEYAVRLELSIVAEMVLPALWIWRRTTRVRRRPLGPVGRGIFTAAAAMSLLLGAATVVFWVRSYSRCEDINRFAVAADGVQTAATIWSWHGSIYFWNNRGTRSPALPARPVEWPVHSVQTQRARFATTLNALPNRLFADPNVTYSGQWQYGYGGVMLAGRQTVTRSTTNVGPVIAVFYFWGAIVPYWLITLLLFTSPALWSVTCLRRAMRHTAGHCRQCGYNLTANTSGICPEC